MAVDEGARYWRWGHHGGHMRWAKVRAAVLSLELGLYVDA